MVVGVGRIEKTGLKPGKITDVITRSPLAIENYCLHHDSSVTSRSKMTKYEKEFYKYSSHPQRGGGDIIS